MARDLQQVSLQGKGRVAMALVLRAHQGRLDVRSTGGIGKVVVVREDRQLNGQLRSGGLGSDDQWEQQMAQGAAVGSPFAMLHAA